MFVVITGGSGSGKSAYAEEVFLSLEKNQTEYRRYYLATMVAFGKEGEETVKRHKRLRCGKGFLTLEQPLDIGSCRMEAGKNMALLECMSNLVANEMFRAEGKREAEEVAEKITAEIEMLRRRLEHLVVVTNNVFEDGVCYGDETMDYLRALGRVNRNIAAVADVVTEVAAGIPLDIKGERIL